LVSYSNNINLVKSNIKDTSPINMLYIAFVVIFFRLIC
jgi:hypothetical protein